MKLLKKKRIISSIFPVMLVLVAVLFGSPLTASAEEAWDGTAFSTDFAGSGTEADPYQIGTAKELAGLSQIVSGGNYTNSDGLAYAEAYYVLTADIVLNESLEGAPVEWNPIGDDAEDTFKGQFDGKGHTVSGVYILNEFKYNPGSGLFGYSEGTIQNVGVINSRIDSSSQYVGGICGYNMGSILNCYSTAAVSGEHFQHEEEVGGICGMNDGGTVENCFYAGKVKGAEDIGGICGENYQGTIKNCYSHAEFTIGGVDTKVGFVCGTNEDGTITDCYYAESFNLRNAVGTSTGTATDSCRGLTVEELAALDIDGAGTTWIAGEVEETEQDGKFKTVTYTLPKLAGVGEAITPTTALYNFDVGNGDNWKTYVKVTTTEELQAMKDALNNSYVLMNDIAFTANLDADGRLIENPTETWIPIGNYEIFDSPSFTGCFDGAGHSISGLYIDVVETDGGSASGEDTAYYGLFGYSEGTIANVSVTESSISATGFFNAVAGICGENQNGVIYNCCFEGTLSGEFRVEGICNVNTGTVENCYSLGEINSSGNGICGTNTGTVKDCFSTMAIQDGAIICGHNSGGKIENCYYSTDLFVGDAIGSNEGDVTETVYGLSVEEFAALDFDGNGTAWTDGSVKEVMKGDRFKTVTYTLPSLKNGGIICSSTIEKYLFIIDGEESWQQYKPVSTIEELQAINHDLYGNYVLMNDITVEENLDRNGKLLANPVKEWAGIGCEESFKGIFDGRGFTVSGLYADDSANANGGGWGLFGSVEGTIMNVGVTESHFFMGNASAGGICGELDGEGIIRSCYNTATVEGTVSVGGICGSVETSLEDGVAISNCYNVGKIIATYSYAGGICGQNWDGVIEDCYSAGTVEGDSYIGGLCGQVMNGAVRNCWFDCDVAPIYPIGEIYNSEQTGVFKYGTAVMTGDDILTAMGFDKSIWGKKANDVANGIAYYPDLLCFADDEPSTKYVAPTPTATPGTDTGVTPAPTTEPGTAPTPGADATPVPTVEPGATPAPGGDVSPTLAPDMTPTPGGDTDVTPAPETVEQVKNFVTRMYTVVLARTPDEAGINDWTSWLLGHEIDGAGIAYGFIMSDEFVNKNLSDEEFIAVLYSTFFDRAADPEGLATWTNLLAQGSSRGFVLSGFVNSNEFDVLCESFGIVRGTMREDGTAVNPGIRQFVERCYSTVLGREGDKGGLDTWTNLIIAGEMSAETVAKTFFDSEEFINKGTTDADYINILYATFLDRVADEAGRATWADGLAGGMTRAEVLQGFSQSEEFKGILAGFGLQ